MLWEDGAKYEGDWVLNFACGQGKFTYPDGSTYVGTWKNSKANGQGVY